MHLLYLLLLFRKIIIIIIVHGHLMDFIVFYPTSVLSLLYFESKLYFSVVLLIKFEKHIRSSKNPPKITSRYKIFDEILVNAADNFQRDPKRMDYIKVTFSQKEGKIVIENNGRSLPVQKHEKEKM
jgi:hypothetical protein